MSEPPIVEARGLTRTYRKGASVIRAISDLDLEVPAGEFLALMGPSGSGSRPCST